MICPQCKVNDQRSTVHIGAGMSTAMYSAPYYDEDGTYHFHDRNSHTKSYSCSNGHRWAETATNRCPGCDWTKEGS